MLFKKDKIYIIDGSALADGRILVLFRSGIISGRVLVPAGVPEHEDGRWQKKFEENLKQLETIADVKIEKTRQLEQDADLVATAKKKRAKVFTIREELKKLSTEYTILIDELYESLRPAYLAGEETVVRIVKKGKGQTEGIGYLKDGTMVVVEDGAEFQGMNIEIIITGMTETTVGRLVFAKPKYR